MIDHRGLVVVGPSTVSLVHTWINYILLVLLIMGSLCTADVAPGILESSRRMSVPLCHPDEPRSDILALACKEAIPARWTGAPWPTVRRLGDPPERATPPSVPQPRQSLQRCPTAEGWAMRGLQGLHVDGARKSWSR